MKLRTFHNVLLEAALLICASVAQAQNAEPFYKGKSIYLVIPSAPGGINDLAGRVVAKHMRRFIPGEPDIVTQDLPGQVGVVLANRMYNAVAKDGLTIAFMERAIPQLAIQGDANVKFDPLKFTWLGSLSSYENDAFMLTLMARSPIRTVADLKAAPTSLHLGALGPGTTTFIFGYIAKDILGMNVTVVRGYPGAAPIFLGMQSGELDGIVVGLGAIKAGQLALWNDRQFRPLIQFGRATRSTELPDIPTGRELAPDANTRALIEFAELPFFMALPYYAPPDIPADRAEILQNAFMQMTKDADYIADATRLSIELSPIDGNAIRKLLERAAASPRNVIDDYNRLLTR